MTNMASACKCHCMAADVIPSIATYSSYIIQQPKALKLSCCSSYNICWEFFVCDWANKLITLFCYEVWEARESVTLGSMKSRQ